MTAEEHRVIHNAAKRLPVTASTMTRNVVTQAVAFFIGHQSGGEMENLDS